MPGDAKSRSRKAEPARVPTLAELQDAFQKAVVDGDEAILRLIPGNTRTSSAVLIGVYRYAYAARLVDIAAADYARLHIYMGGETFASMARAYLAAHPSHTPNARWFSRQLPEFLRSTRPYSAHPELAELAQLERAIADAFDSADDPVASLETLKPICPEDWANLRFVPHRSVTRLDLATNAHAIWNALKDETEPPAAAALAEPQRLAVWREETISKVRPLGAEEAMLWDEAAKGVPFGALCELAAVFDDPGSAAVRAARCLAGWLAAGMISKAGIGVAGVTE